MVNDPTGLVDAANAVGYALRGKWGEAAVSAMGIVPYVGDVAKIGKLPRMAEKGDELAHYLRFENEVSLDKQFVGKIRTYKEWKATLAGQLKEQGLEIHYLIERRFASLLGVKHGELPSVVLPKEYHQKVVSSALFRQVPTNRSFTAQDVWNAYKKVYGPVPNGLGHEDWLEAIWPYCERLGVQR